jgi:plastocyanin
MRGVLTAAVFVLSVAGAGGESPATGTITGHVTLTSHVRSTALPSTVYQPRAVAHRTTRPLPEIRNVVISLKDAPFTGALAASRTTIRQEGETFLPRVVAATRGSTIDFPNGDPVFHNVFSLSSAATFDLGRYPMGRSKSVTLDKAGLVKVYCHIHSQMSASIVVFDHPYFTIPDLDGSFTLANVPPGRYTIAGWHERVGERTVSIDVRAGTTSSVEISLPVEDEP